MIIERLWIIVKGLLKDYDNGNTKTDYWKSSKDYERLWAIVKGLLKDYEDHQRL